MQTSAVCASCGYTKVTSAAKIAKVSAPKLAKTVYTYNGKVQKPSVTVKDSTGKPLKAGADYTVNYPKGRKAVGRYGVQVKLKGKYKARAPCTLPSSQRHINQQSDWRKKENYRNLEKAESPNHRVSNPVQYIVEL